MTKLRVGAVSYLNTKPLIRHLAELAPDIELILDVPSRLAHDLADERLDVALIPSIEYFRGENYSIIPGASIAAFGHVMSVKLVSRVPFAQIKTVATDEGSRTSIALMKVLLHHVFGVDVETLNLPMSASPAEAKADACLVIGDRAMKIADGDYPYSLDLGYEWSRWTGLPFVFAFWSVREGVEIPTRVLEAFERSKELGRQDIPAIVQEESSRLGVDEVRCRYYLEHVIHHDLGPRERAGLQRFYELASGLGLAPEGRSCVFHGREHLAESR